VPVGGEGKTWQSAADAGLDWIVSVQAVVSNIAGNQKRRTVSVKA
jgi:hypothetical protein